MSETRGTVTRIRGCLINGNWICLSRKCVIIVLGCLLAISQLLYHYTSTPLQYTMSLDSYSLPCEMPYLDPFDPIQMGNVRKVKPIKCPEKHNPVYVHGDNILQFNDTALTALRLVADTINCVCQRIVRALDSDNDVTLSESFTCTPPYNVPSDFFKIICSSDEKQVVDTLLTKINRTSKPFGAIKDNFYNVILFGIDSVSRNDAYRQIPKTVKYLKDKLGGIEMLLYNRIGGHSFDNILPLITGHFANNVDIPYYDDVTVRFQTFPFVWKNMSYNNYATFYAEDVLGFNTFNFQKEGFSEQPTTHYMRPFFQTDYDLRPNILFWKDSTSNYNKRRCLVNTPKYLVLMNYLKQFINTYKDVRKFSMSHINDLAHQDVNELHQVDDHIVNFFKWLKDSGNLGNSFVFVYSDHGPRGQSSTHQSTMETNLPYLSIIPPLNITRDYPQLIDNLKKNAPLLTTHFDLYATLRDITLRNYNHPTVYYVNNKPRGISLLREIKTQRSCQEASIPEGACSCYRSKLLNVTDNPFTQDLANSVVVKLNDMMSKSSQCAFLSLNKLIEVRVLVQGKQIEKRNQGMFHRYSNIVNEKDYSDYKVVIETVPGNGRFFATSKMAANGNRYILDNIERLNRYNNQSHCVREDILRPLCYCKDLLNSRNV